MSTSSNLDRICVAALALAVLIAALAFCAPALGYEAASGGVVLGYEERLFDTSVVHTIDIVMDDWEGFIAGCEDEEYVLCDLVIDGEDWGLYLAVEGVEERFLLRNYGELYKPDSMEMGGGRGNGGGFSGRGGMGGMPSDMGEPPEDMDGMPDMSEMPEMGEIPDMGEVPEMGEMPEMGGGMGGGMMGGSSDVLLVYTDDDYDSYANIFDNAKTDVSNADKDRLIDALQALGEGGDVSDCVDIESVISYFVAHNFVCNFDSYTGSMIHNYYLYEDGGLLSMLPWDYNLAFGGFMGSSDAEALVNWSIDDPTSDGDTESRPMLAWTFESEEYTELYHAAFAEFIESVFTSGEFERLFDETVELISPYVERDPTKFCTYEEFELGAETLREFCLLRAESIGYQLAGEDVTVDASGLDISAMGSMNNTAGGGGKGFRG